MDFGSSIEKHLQNVQQYSTSKVNKRSMVRIKICLSKKSAGSAEFTTYGKWFNQIKVNRAQFDEIDLCVEAEPSKTFTFQLCIDWSNIFRQWNYSCTVRARFAISLRHLDHEKRISGRGGTENTEIHERGAKARRESHVSSTSTPHHITKKTKKQKIRLCSSCHRPWANCLDARDELFTFLFRGDSWGLMVLLVHFEHVRPTHVLL